MEMSPNLIQEENHLFAKNLKGDEIHISKAISGKNGYYCTGCNREMIAKKGSIKTHHFAHDAKDIIGIEKCPYSDEQYRHKLGKEILQRIKQIKVPAVYILPLFDKEGKAMKISESKVVFANEVRIELEFYENDDGEIKFGRNIDYKNTSKHLLFKPDVAFFDNKGKPILLIELVATHKVDVDKLAKIKLLGIDLIEVSIPKDSQEEIEATFYHTNRTQWLYNYEQENTQYIPIPQGNAEGISSINEFQRRIFESVWT